MEGSGVWSGGEGRENVWMRKDLAWVVGEDKIEIELV